MRRGRPVARIVLSPSEREALERSTRRSDDGTSVGAARPNRVAVCRRGDPHGHRRGPAHDEADRGQMAPAVCGGARARIAGRAAPRRAATGHGCRRRTGDCHDAGVDAARCDALEHAILGHAGGTEPIGRSPHMKAFALQPHRTETFKLSKDPLFIEKVRDIVGLYLHPPDRALVLCVDEKSHIQALDRTAPLLPMRPVQPERRTHYYVRHGTTSLFAALDVKSGIVIGTCHARHRALEFRKCLDRIDAAAPADLDVHLILVDNYATHKTPFRGGSPGIPGTTCTSPRPVPRGSTSLSADSSRSRASRFDGAPTRAQSLCVRRFATTST
jgi:hypothetical protein